MFYFLAKKITTKIIVSYCLLSKKNFFGFIRCQIYWLVKLTQDCLLANENVRASHFFWPTFSLPLFWQKYTEKKHKQKKSVKEQTQKIDSLESFLPTITHYRKAEKIFFPKKVTS